MTETIGKAWHGFRAWMSMLRHLLAFSAALLIASPVMAQAILPFSGSRTVHSNIEFAETIGRLEKSIVDNKILLLSKASASVGAAGAGIKIPGNAVLFVFRNDFARRLLAVNVAAGFEAPLRIYVTEGSDGKASVSWRLPSELFSVYGSPEVASVAAELDAVLERIVGDALR